MEARWRRCADRVLGDHPDRRLYAALSAMPGKEALGGSGYSVRGFGRSSFVGRAATDVHVYAGQPASMAPRRCPGSAQTPVLDTTAVPPMAESARRIRARPRPVVCLWGRPDHGDCSRQHTLAGSTPHPPAGAAASAGLFGARASQSQRRATLSLSVRYFTFACDAVVHLGVFLTRFS